MKHTYLALTLLLSTVAPTSVTRCNCHDAKEVKNNNEHTCLCVQKGESCQCMENATRTNTPCPCVNSQVKSETPCMCVQKGSACNCAEAPVKTNISCPCTQVVAKNECACVQKGGSCCCTQNNQQTSQSITAEIAYGDLIDRMTILEIKMNNITDEVKRKNVQTELDALTKTFDTMINTFGEHIDEVLELKENLYNTNQDLWNVEDAVRLKEAQQMFDEEFIELARRVYKINDARCAIKRKLNLLLNSPLIEEKSHQEY